jgi:hypothetical protein
MHLSGLQCVCHVFCNWVKLNQPSSIHLLFNILKSNNKIWERLRFSLLILFLSFVLINALKGIVSRDQEGVLMIPVYSWDVCRVLL